MKYTSTLLGSSLLLLALGGCGTNNDTPIVKEVESISVSPSSANILSTKNEFELNASVHYSDGSESDVKEAARWETDFSKASLSYGKLTPKVNGDGNGNDIDISVTASYKGLEDTASVTIVPLTKLHIDDSNTSGDPKADVDYLFKATGEYKDGENNVSIDENNSNEIVWSVEGNATLVDVKGGMATISFTKGDANVTISAFDEINATKSYHISE